MMGPFGYGPMFGFGWVWMLVGTLFWIVVLGLVVWAVVRLFPSRREQTTPLDILKERYARGEITQAEFEQARRALS